MGNIGTFISILVGLATLSSVHVCFWRIMKSVNVQSKKLDDLSSDIVEVKELVHLMTRHDKKFDDLSKDIADLKYEQPQLRHC